MHNNFVVMHHAGGVCCLPAQLPLKVSHVLLALCIVLGLGLDEVVQAPQVVSLYTNMDINSFLSQAVALNAHTSIYAIMSVLACVCVCS